MGNFGGFIQILVFVFIIAGPVIGAIAKKAKAHAEQKRLEVERDRRKVQALRTGQPIPEVDRDQRQSADATRRAKLEELQRRRQAQIEELRRRHREAQAQASQQKSQQTGRQPARGAQQTRAAQTSTPVQPLPGSPGHPGPPGRPAQSIPNHAKHPHTTADAARQAELERRRAEIRARREQYERAKAQAQAKARAKQKQRPAKSAKPRLKPKAPTVIAARPRAGSPIEAATLASAMRDPASIRRAIVMNEILSPPISLRKSEGMAG